MQTFSPPGFCAKITVNNPGCQNPGAADFIGRFVLLTRCSPALSGEQAVHINSLSVWRFPL
jgi:hypothetical protein